MVRGMYNQDVSNGEDAQKSRSSPSLVIFIWSRTVGYVQIFLGLPFSSDGLFYVKVDVLCVFWAKGPFSLSLFFFLVPSHFYVMSFY